MIFEYRREKYRDRKVMEKYKRKMIQMEAQKQKLAEQKAETEK